MKFSMKDFFSKCDQMFKRLRIWSHLLKKSLIQNFIFGAVKVKCSGVDLFSFFLDSRSLFVLYAYVSIESIDYFLFSSFKLKTILVISSLKTLCFSLLNLCFVFRISIFFYEFLVIFFKTMYANFIFLYK